MAEKEIALLKEQIERLNEKKFDLEAWKNYTLIIIERIFGKEDSKLKMIRSLAYDYSSWSLRDTAASGKTKDKDPVRLQAEEILEAAITELESLGLPETSQGKEKIWRLLEDELTGKQLKDLEKLVNSDEPDRKENIGKIIGELGNEKLVSIILQLLIK